MARNAETHGRMAGAVMRREMKIFEDWTKMRCGISMVRRPIYVDKMIKDFWNGSPHCLPNLGPYPCGKQHLRSIATPDWVGHFYALQTKILEGRINISECVFEALFNVSWPKSGTHALKSASKMQSDVFLEGWTKDEMLVFDWLFNDSLAQIEYSHPWKVLRKPAFHPFKIFVQEA